MFALGLILFASAADPSVSDIVTAGFNHLPAFQRFSARFDLETTCLEAPKIPPNTRVDQKQVEVIRDGQKWRIKLDRVLDYPARGKWRTQRQRHVHIADGDVVSSVPLEEPAPRNRARQLVLDRNTIPGESPQLPVVIGAMLFGQLTDLPGRAPELLAGRGTTVSREERKGVATIKLFRSTPNGDVTAWFDARPGAGGLLALREERTREQLYRNKPLPGPGEFSYERTFRELEVVRRAQFDSWSIPVEWSVRSESKSTYAGDSVAHVTRVALSGLNLRPDVSDTTFSVGSYVSDGMPVVDFRDPNVSYVWRGGRPERSFNESFGAMTFEQSAPARSWWPAAGAVAAAGLAVGGSAWWWTRRRESP